MGSLGVQEERVFKFLLELDTSRGPHSTGVCVVPRNETEYLKPKVVKSLGTPWMLYEAPEWKTALTGINKVVMGHNRWATRGAITADNAHPFEFDKVIGAHNGTIHNQHFFDSKHLYQVDSQSLYSHLNSAEDVKSTLENINGAFALTWWDKQAKTMNFARNKDRPLCFVLSENGQCLFWASEAWMLSIALQKAGMKVGEIRQFTELMHYVFDLNGAAGQPLQKPRVSIIKEYVPPVFKGGYRSTWGDQFEEYDGYNGFRRKKFQEVYNPPANQQQKVLPSPQQQPQQQQPQQQPAGKKLGKYGAGEYITFTIVKVIFDSVGAENGRIEAQIVGNTSIPVYLFPKKHSVDWKLLAHVGLRFRGKIKKVSEKPRYLLVDLRSIVVDKGLNTLNVRDLSDEDGDEDDEVLYPVGSRGHKMCKEDFIVATSQGCGVCGMTAHPEDAASIVWVYDDKEYICPDCTNTDIAKQYITHSNSSAKHGGC
jgi:hypothetical protein